MKIMLQVIKLVGTCKKQQMFSRIAIFNINRCNFCFAPFKVKGLEEECKVEDGSN